MEQNSEKSLEDKLKGHVHTPKPTQFFSMVNYQCGCGLYFTKEQYVKYCNKNGLKPIFTVEELQESRKRL